MLTVPDFHGQNAPKEELEAVSILPYVAGSPYQDGETFTIPNGLKWSDFVGGVKGAIELGTNDSLSTGGGLYPVDVLVVGQDISFRDTNNTAAAARAVSVTLLTETTGRVNVLSTGGQAGTGLQYLIGERKKYATKNLSRTISVNLGNDIAVNSRYEVDLPSEFYEADGSIKKGVQVRAEIYVAGSEYVGYAAIPFRDAQINSVLYHYGVEAQILEDRVVVDTAGYGTDFAGDQSLLASAAVSNPWGLSGVSPTSAPCQVIATLNDTYILSVEPAQGSFERIVNAGLDVLEFTNNGDYAYVPLSDADFDGDIFEYNSTTRFLRPKKSGKHIPSVFSHAEDGAGQARVKYVLVQADTAQGDNPVVVTGVFTKQYTSDGGTQSIHTPVNLDESKWYALYAENFTSGNVTYTSLVSPTSDPDLGDITDYAFIFSLERG